MPHAHPPHPAGVPDADPGRHQELIAVLEDQSQPGAIEALQRRVGDAVGAGRRRLVIDVRGAPPSDPRTVGAFCAALRRVPRGGVAVSVLGLPPHARRTLELCDIDGVESAEANPAS